MPHPRPYRFIGMKFTYDALLHIISLSESANDTVPLMATCRALYHEGPKIALKKVAIISTEEQLASFLKFLRADNLSRCRYLRRLELWACSPPEPDVVQELIETLPLLTNIEHLRLVGAEDLLHLHPDLPTAFGSLITLQHITFNEAAEETCALLLELHSPLITLKIDFTSDSRLFWDDLDDYEWEKSHPTMLLANFALTLEELQCISWWTIDSETVVPTQVYPNMRKLSIECHEFPLRIDPFIRAFPNLADLRVNTNYHSGYYLGAMQRSHVTNVTQQLDPVNPCGTWAHLEHFEGTLIDLYGVGLTFHVPRVTIVDRLEHERPRTMNMLATVLHYARPLHLKLGGLTGSMLGDTDQGFISMLRDDRLSNLINLDLCIYFAEDDREKDLAPIVDNLVAALTGLPLKFLRLDFETGDPDPTPREQNNWDQMVSCSFERLSEPPEPTPAPLTPAEVSLKALDVNALTARLESMPSLEAAYILLPSSRYGHELGGDWKGQGYERVITKGMSCLPGREQ